MKTLVPIIALSVMVLMVIPVMGGEKAAMKAFYKSAIDQEIRLCKEQTVLLSSRSPNLRLKGHREASKAIFLETHRDALVEDMVRLDLEPKDYMVDRFLNGRFCNTCYATWATK